MTDSGLGSWTDDRTARERVRETATTLTEPRSVEWVREQARISSWQTVKDELEMLVEFDGLLAHYQRFKQEVREHGHDWH